MALLEKLFERRDATLSLTNYQQWVDLGLVSGTASGVSVTPEGALKHSAVYACVRILAETVASLPLIIYERLERGKRRAEKHHLYELLKDRPNEVMTSFEYRETLQGHLALRGNAYSEVVYNGAGQVVELWPLRPDHMLQIVESDGLRLYHYMLPSGRMRWLDDTHIWHLRGMGSDGRYGYSPIHLARQAIGLGMAAEEFGARFFSNGAEPGVVLQHPGTLSDDAHQRIRGSWNEMHQGLEKRHRLAIVEEGMTVEKIGIPPDDAQFLETRKFQLQEIARIYRIPPHMLADLDRATFSNIEHQAIEFVQHTMRPWLVRWEQSIKARLMLPDDRRRFFPEFLVDALLRGDILSRYQAYAAARQNGWFSANDIRELENMNPVDGGDIYLVPLNMVPTSAIGDEPRLRPSQASARAVEETAQEQAREDRAVRSVTARRRLGNAYRPVIGQAATRILRAEIREVRKAAKKMLQRRDLQEFENWLRSVDEDHQAFIQREMLPVLLSYAEAIAGEATAEIGGEAEVTAEFQRFIQEYVQFYSERHAGSSSGQIRKLLEEAGREGQDLVAALEVRFGEWESDRPGQIAGWESVRAGNAFARFAYVAAGVTLLRWVASGKNCPYCSRLDGRVISVTQAFIEEGQAFEGDGGADPLVPDSRIGHPPAHRGCDCSIMADFGRELPVSVETRQAPREFVTMLDRLAERLEQMANRSIGQMPNPILQVPAGSAIPAPTQVVVHSTDEAVLRELAASIRQASEQTADRVSEALAGIQERVEAQVAETEMRSSGVMASAMEMIGELVKALREQGPPKVETRIEPAPVTVISQPFPKRMVETQKILRDKKGTMLGTRGEREYLEE